MAVATKMPVDEIAVALAMHCKLFGDDPRVARAQLDPTPRAHFDEACVWASSNDKVVKLILEDPKAIAAGSYTLSPARGWLSRLFNFGKKDTTPSTNDELEQVMRDMADSRRDSDVDRRRRMEALRDLVDESFDSA